MFAGLYIYIVMMWTKLIQPSLQWISFFCFCDLENRSRSSTWSRDNSSMNHYITTLPWLQLNNKLERRIVAQIFDKGNYSGVGAWLQQISIHVSPPKSSHFVNAFWKRFPWMCLWIWWGWLFKCLQVSLQNNWFLKINKCYWHDEVVLKDVI